MGILRDARYWAGVTNEIWRLRPLPGQPMKEDDAKALFGAACRALSDLVADKDFKSDLDAAIEVAGKAMKKKDRALPEFGGFLNEFHRAEMPVLLQSGVNMDAAIKVLNEISDLSRDVTNAAERLEGLGGKIAYCAELACSSIVKLREKPSIWFSVRRVVTGVALISIDSVVAGGVALYLPLFAGGVAGSVVGISVGYGVDAVTSGTKQIKSYF